MIPMDECEAGRLYRIRSRNLIVGVWNPESRGFIGIRMKFGSKYLFTEFHHDVGPPFNTVMPIEAMAFKIPDSVDLIEGYPEEQENGRKAWVDNAALFAWLTPHDNAENERLSALRESEALERASDAMRPRTAREAAYGDAMEGLRVWLKAKGLYRDHRDEYLRRYAEIRKEFGNG